MAGRIRTIKPEVLDDELAASLTDTAWRVWVSMWVLCDDFGNVRAAPKYLAAQVWQDTNRVADAVKALEELSTKTVDPGQKPMIFLYAADGQTYAHIKGFDKHQRQDNRSKKPRVPGPPDGFEGIQELTRHLAAKTRNSRRRKSDRTDPPRSGDPDQKVAALTSDLRPPTPTPTTDPSCPSGVKGQGELFATTQKPPLEGPKAEEEAPRQEPAVPETAPAKAESGQGSEPEMDSEPDSPHKQVIACYFEEFTAVRGQKPVFGSVEGKCVKLLLEKLKGDVDRACAAIKGAYADRWWKERVTIQGISTDPSKFLGNQLPLVSVVKGKGGWVPKDDPVREQALEDGPREGKAF